MTLATTADQVGAIRQAIADRLAAVTGTQVSAYMLSNPTPPCIHVYPGGPAGDIEYHDTAGPGALETWPFTVQAFVPDTTDIGSQKNLDQYVASTGPQSVRAGIEDGSSLGGLVDDVLVVRCLPYRRFTFDGIRPPAIGAEWHLHCMVRPS